MSRRVLRALSVALVCLAGPVGAATLVYIYDELGRLVAEIDPAAETTLYEYDAAGNILAVSRGASSAFRLIGFSPAHGKPGDTVTIYGSGFVADLGQNQVTFNGAPAMVTSASANTLVVTVPAGATTGPITLSNPSGSGATARPFLVVFPPVIASVNPSSVSRGAVTRITISGEHLLTGRAVSFEQPGFAARVVPGTSDTELAVDLTVAATVPLGAFPFSLSNDAGSTHSGSVTVSVSTSLLGDVTTVTRTLSVHRPVAEPNAAPGTSMSVSRVPISVQMPEPDLGPIGNAMSVTPLTVSVHLPTLIAGAPAGNAMSVTPLPVSVHLPVAIPGAPPGDSMTVTQPISVSLP
jgi:YD repeat-containing protein